MSAKSRQRKQRNPQQQQQQQRPPQESSTVGAAQELSEDIRRLSVASPSPPTSITPRFSTHNFPLRREFGSKGKQVRLSVNHFRVHLDLKGDVYHYDVAMKEKGQSTSGTLFPKEVTKKVLMSLISRMKQELPDFCIVSDNRKNLYSSKRLPFAEKRFSDVQYSSDGRERIFECTVHEVDPVAVRMEQLPALFRNQINYTPYDAIQALDIAARYSASTRFTAVGRSLFTSDGAQYLGGGADVWFGYFQSLRPTQSGLTVNLDLSATAFVSAMPVLDFLVEILGERSLSGSWSKYQHSTFSKAIRGVKVYTTHSPVRRTYRVNGLSPKPANQTFFEDDQGKKTSVSDYFARTYRPLRYSMLPCLHVGAVNKKIYIPLEVCHTKEGQKCPRKIDDKQVAEMIKFTCVEPQNRKKSIQDKFSVAGYDRDPIMREFGLGVDPEMIKLNGRVLPEPQLLYGKNRRENPREGVWNLREKQFYQGSILESWAIISRCDKRKCDVQTIRKFFQAVLRQAQELGMSFPSKLPPIVESRSARDSVRFQFNEAVRLARDAFGKPPQIIWMINPTTDAFAYGELKRVSDTEQGIVSQCMLQKHIYKANGQYIANILMKVNTKLGGKNVITNSGLPKVSDRPTIVFGADVTHPSPMDKTRPSIAAVVASIDSHCLKHAATLRQQGHRVEHIEDLEGMVRELLLAFYRAAGRRKPERIVFYRDGVSEGQFLQVLNHEVTAIRAACTSLEKDYQPPITFIVVQKRHNTRFFVEDRRDADRSGNVKAGTVVDSTICHPTENDFYLMSHAGIKGTSRPTHYHVLLDEIGFGADELQTLTYNLCYTYARCTRSVSMVPSTYYSHLLAYRARFFLPDGSETASTASGQSEVDVNVKMLEVHDNLKSTMFYV